MRSLTGLPDLGPSWTDRGPMFSATDTALSTIYWPWLVDTATVPGTFPRRWRLYYSTDHAAGAGGVAYSEADQPTGPWTHHPVIYVDTTVDTFQTETPSVVYVPETRLWHMYYQQSNVEGGQRTLLATSADGLAWTRQGVALSIPLVGGAPDTRWPGQQIHTGYAIPHRLPGGRWLMYHLLAGGDRPYFGQSWSEDGIHWQIDPRPLMYDIHLTHQFAERRIEWNTGYLVEHEGVLWWVGTITDFISGAVPRSAFLVQAPMGADYRTFLAPPRAVFGPNNFRSMNVTTDADGSTWLIRQDGTSFFLAVGNDAA
jgi:hypothetical protein